MEPGPWCRHCALPARVEGEPELGRAVHAGTGQELGPDGHLCAPVGFWTAGMRIRRRASRVALGFP
jgi:hypothetical protein